MISNEDPLQGRQVQTAKCFITEYTTLNTLFLQHLFNNDADGGVVVGFLIVF